MRSLYVKDQGKRFYSSKFALPVVIRLHSKTKLVRHSSPFVCKQLEVLYL
jgi:hypothetical protein